MLIAAFRGIGAGALVVTIVVFSPLIYIVLLLDGDRLRRAANSIEPEPEWQPIEPTNVIESCEFWLYRCVVEVMIPLLLPMICIAGMIAMAVSPPDDDP